MADTKSPIDRELANIATARAELDQNAALLRGHRSALNKVFHRLQGVDDIDVSAYGRTIMVYATARDLSGMQCKRLTDLLSRFVADWIALPTEDNAEALARVFRFRLELPDDKRIELRLNAMVKTDSPTCRKVEVGRRRRVLVQKEYRIECNG